MWVLIFAAVVVGLQCVLSGGFSSLLCHPETQFFCFCYCKVGAGWRWEIEYQGGSRAPHGVKFCCTCHLLSPPTFNQSNFLLKLAFVLIFLLSFKFCLRLCDGSVWRANLVRQTSVLVRRRERPLPSEGAFPSQTNATKLEKTSLKFGSLNTILKYKWILAEDFKTGWH